MYSKLSLTSTDKCNTTSDFSTSCTNDKIILSICKNEYAEFLSKANVVAIGLGYKQVKGIPTKEKCLQVFVTKKIPLQCLDSIDLVPSYYEGIKTDVIESGGSFTTMALKNKIRPVIGGYSISNSLNTSVTGSYACLVTDNTSYYLLANNHIIASENSAPIGTPILNPGISDGGKNPQDKIAILERFIPIKFLTPNSISNNFVDAAIAKIIDPSLISSDICFTGPPSGIIDSYLGQTSQIVGRSTEYSLGLVLSVCVTTKINFTNNKVAIFSNQIITTNNVSFGDSGALVVDKTNKGAIGLLCGGSSILSVINPIQDVLNSLNVSLVVK